MTPCPWMLDDLFHSCTCLAPPVSFPAICRANYLTFLFFVQRIKNKLSEIERKSADFL